MSYEGDGFPEGEFEFAQDLMEELEIATSVRKAQVREAQEKIVMAAQKLADEGVIMLGPETEEGA